MKVICASCEAEGKPALIGERAPLNASTEVYGLCWTHKLQLLLRKRTAPEFARDNQREDPLRFLVVVAGHEQDLFLRVSEQFLDDPRVRVLLDRRRRERRRRHQAYEPDRRRADRRRVPDYWEDLRHHSVVIVPTWMKGDSGRAIPVASAPTEPEAAAVDRVDAALPTRDRINQWVQEGADLLGRVMPTLFDEFEGLWRRSRAAEDRLQALESESAKLQAELEELKRLRTETAEVMQTYAEEIARLTDVLLFKIKGT